ncbi:hypothetical protein JW859_14760 [bacterium]|nr:hypothetical protein [bacterium]
MAGINPKVFGLRLLLTMPVTLVLCGFLSTCSDANLAELPPDDLGYTFQYAYLLYVEEVILPEVIYEDEPVYFDLRVSAEANPEALKHLSHASWSAISPNFQLYTDPTELWMIDACVSAGSDSMPDASNLLPVSIPGMPVGEWICVVRCAAERVLGGKKVKYQLMPSSGPVTADENLQELKFNVNVVERPEE